MSLSEQVKIQIQCQKDWAIYQAKTEDQKEGVIVYECPVCHSLLYVVVPTESTEQQVTDIPSDILPQDQPTEQPVASTKPSPQVEPSEIQT